MTYFIKHNIIVIVAILLLSVLYFILRIPNLTQQPIFADEAIYIRWAQVMTAEPTLRFLPQSDGKTPLFMWGMIPLLKVFTDPLFAGRILSVFVGFMTFLGVLFIGWRYFNKYVGIIAAALMVVVPYILFFDRMALVDSMSAMFTVWALAFALLLIQTERIDVAMGLGYLLGGGLLTKPPGFFNVLALPISLIVFNFMSHQRELRVLKLAGLWLISLVITFSLYGILWLGPGFGNLSSRNQDYVFAPFELIGRPLDPFIPHLRDLVDWFPKFFTFPVLIFILVGFGLVLIKRHKYGLAVLAWSLLPLLIQMAFLKTFTTRYILSSIPLLLILAAYGIYEVVKLVPARRKVVVWVLIGVLSFPALLSDYKILFNPGSAAIPEESRRGYFEEWTAGYGLKQIAQYLENQAKNGAIVVGTEGSFGTLPDGLQIYLERYVHSVPSNRQIYVVGGKGEVTTELTNALKTHRVFFVANGSQIKTSDIALTPVMTFNKMPDKDGNIDTVILYELLPSPVERTALEQSSKTMK